MELSTDIILEENLVQSAFPPATGRLIHISAGQNLKQKAKATPELLTKKTVNVSE